MTNQAVSNGRPFATVDIEGSIVRNNSSIFYPMNNAIHFDGQSTIILSIFRILNIRIIWQSIRSATIDRAMIVRMQSVHRDVVGTDKSHIIIEMDLERMITNTHTRKDQLCPT